METHLQQPHQTDRLSILDANQYRAWLEFAISELEVSPHAVGKVAELPNNAVRKFLDRKQVDIHLSTAAKITTAIYSMADMAGKTVSACKVHEADHD